MNGIWHAWAGGPGQEGIALIPVGDMLDHSHGRHMAWHTGAAGTEPFTFITHTPIPKACFHAAPPDSKPVQASAGKEFCRRSTWQLGSLHLHTCRLQAHEVWQTSCVI